jgi:hypothetical protein
VVVALWRTRPGSNPGHIVGDGPTSFFSVHCARKRGGGAAVPGMEPKFYAIYLLCQIERVAGMPLNVRTECSNLSHRTPGVMEH